MKFRVLLTDDAAGDLASLYDYIAGHDSPERADYVLDQIERAFWGLSEFPERGTYPNELITLGNREYREIYFKPYRIIYKIEGDSVYVLLIVDGRRNMKTLLEKRLI